MTSEKGVAESSFTKKHELHLATLQMAAVESMEKKYRKGVEEHGMGHGFGRCPPQTWSRRQ
jgi:hypothetical protein